MQRNIQKARANSFATYYRGLVMIYFGRIFQFTKTILFRLIVNICTLLLVITTKYNEPNDKELGQSH